jgi:hypothetical protein
MTSDVNSLQVLTPPGAAAIQILELMSPSADLREKVLGHFEPRSKTQQVLRLGFFKNDEGQLLDEIFLEEQADSFLFHIHGGTVSMFRLKRLLHQWGCEDARSKQPESIEEECLWALEKVRTKEATFLALDNLRLLPGAKSSKKLLDSFTFGESLFKKYKYYLVGVSNAGKSSLINRLLGHERVVVDAKAGTTRDLISVDLKVGPRLIHVVDAAGLRETDNALEREGQISLRNAVSHGIALWVVNPHEEVKACPVKNPRALVLTHQDLGEGAPVEFDGPVLRTALGDDGGEIKDFITKDLPAAVDPPFLFTRRQLDFFSSSNPA